MAIAEGQWLVWSILYTIETVAAFAAGTHMYVSSKPGPARLILLLCVSLAFRTAWCYRHEGTQDQTWYGRLINRISMLTQFLTVSMLVLIWAKLLAKSERERKVVWTLFFGINIVSWLMSLTITFLTTSDNWVYRVDVAFISTLYATCAMALWVYSWRMLDVLDRQHTPVANPATRFGINNLQLDKSEQDEIDETLLQTRQAKLHEVKLKLQVLSCVLVICFTLRAIAFVTEAISDENYWVIFGVEIDIYPSVYYMIPELLPNAIVIVNVANYIRWSAIEEYVNGFMSRCRAALASDGSRATSTHHERYMVLNGGDMDEEDRVSGGFPVARPPDSVARGGGGSVGASPRRDPFRSMMSSMSDDQPYGEDGAEEGDFVGGESRERRGSADAEVI